MNAKLIVRQENGRVTEFPVAKDEIKIGRTAQRNDLVLDDPAVSREHASIRSDPFGVILIDLGSVNGTLVNGDPLHGPRVLAPGDVVSIGNTTLTYRVEEPPKREDVAFGEQDLTGTVMVSMVPEELLSGLKEATAPQTLPPTPIPAADRHDDTDAGRAARAEGLELARLQKKAKILALLYELGRTLGSVFSLPEIYKKASEMLFSVTPADHCLLLLKDPKTGELAPVSIETRAALKSPLADRKGNIVISRTIAERVLREGIALLVYDAQKDFGSDSIMMEAIRSVMCAPLQGKEGILGAIYADRRDLLSRFEEDDLDLLSAIASQTAIAIDGVRTREQLQKEAAVRERLGRFLPAGVVDRVIAGEIKLGGVAQEVTTLFADIRGFTPMSELTSPETVVEVLNEHFTVMTDAVIEFGGTLDKYIGDSVMALFGAPQANPEHDPIHAVDAAIRMQKGMEIVNQKLTARGLPTIRIGIGVNTGRVIVGEIGSEKQMNYTAIGDAVNLAARLESNAKPGQILVSSATARKLKNAFALNQLPPITVKGKAEPIAIYEVVWA
ncbi:MAG TPA: adenylate/guanylate cyclase domain-containing protein [Thermoanaerobaculia bacterium]|nr:adenylate/guanylate cyclase domain-containing protein [Thermoanaerobaculia bacterium]